MVVDDIWVIDHRGLSGSSKWQGDGLITISIGAICHNGNVAAGGGTYKNGGVEGVVIISDDQVTCIAEKGIEGVFEFLGTCKTFVVVGLSGTGFAMEQDEVEIAADTVYGGRCTQHIG